MQQQLSSGFRTAAMIFVAVTALPSGVHAQDGPVVIPAQVPTVAIIDTSGSMLARERQSNQNGFEWLANILSGIDQELQRQGSRAGRYGLVTFLDRPTAIVLDDGVTGSIDSLVEAITRLRGGGGIEDGYAAMKYVLNEYQGTPQIPVHLLIFTDEDRDAADQSLNYERLSEQLGLNNIKVDVMVGVRFRCADKQAAIGMAGDGSGWHVDEAGNVSVCQGAEPFAGDTVRKKIVRDYVDLALSTGGSAWDLTQLRGTSPEHEAVREAFKGVMAQRAQELGRQLPFTAHASAVPQTTRVNLPVTFDGSASVHREPGKSIRLWQWDLDGDGQFESNGPVVAASFDTPGQHTITLRVSDSTDLQVVVQTQVKVQVDP